jgi:hypothetical protein
MFKRRSRRRRVMTWLLTVVSHLAELCLFLAAAAALVMGALGLR